MSCLQKIYTQEINWLQDLKQDLRQKLSSMPSFTERGTQKLELSSEEVLEMAQSLSNDSYEIHLLLTVYENALVERLVADISPDLMEGGFESDQNTVH